MTIIRILTAIAASAVLSSAALAHDHIKVGSGGTASGGAFVEGKDAFGFSTQKVTTETSVRHGSTFTDASSVSVGAAKWGTVIVGGEASAGSGLSIGH
jgi:hypothetical protein